MKDTKAFQGVLYDALSRATDITPSVLSLAMALKVKPGVLAKAIVDAKAVSEYRVQVALAVQQQAIKKAVEEAKAEEAKEE